MTNSYNKFFESILDSFIPPSIMCIRKIPEDERRHIPFSRLHWRPENCCRNIIELYWLVPLHFMILSIKWNLKSVPILLCDFLIIYLSAVWDFRHQALCPQGTYPLPSSPTSPQLACGKTRESITGASSSFCE